MEVGSILRLCWAVGTCELGVFFKNFVISVYIYVFFYYYFKVDDCVLQVLFVLVIVLNWIIGY